VLLCGIGVLLYRFTRGASRTLKTREGILTVALCWIFAALFGTLPYLLAGVHTSFIDAFFESTSTLTTTGASLLDLNSALSHSFLFWRQFTTWLGGMGILVFAISILPMFGYGAASLASAETVGQNVEKISARVTDAAKSVYLIYIVFTVLQIVLLLLGGLGLFDSFILAFSCLANGGFSGLDIAALTKGSGGLYIQILIIIFCVLASLNFANYRKLFSGRAREFFKDAETRTFLLFLGIVSAAVVAVIFVSNPAVPFGETVVNGIFQSSSFVTTAGYKGWNYAAWQGAAHWILIIAMLVGGCSGSTSGGIKIVRVLIAVSVIKRNFYKKIHPNAVVVVKVGDNAVSGDRVWGIATFFLVYAGVALISCVVLSVDGLDPGATLSTVIAGLSNTGLIIGQGAARAIATLSPFSRLLFSFLMLVGRLEIFTIFLLFTPAFWRPYR